MSAAEAREEWYAVHGDFPRLVLGWRDDRGGITCLDHANTKRRRTVLLTEDDDGEYASCRVCGGRLRRAEAFGTFDEADL